MEMVLGVMEGQIRGGYFLDSILDPSVVDRTLQSSLVLWVTSTMLAIGSPKPLSQNMTCTSVSVSHLSRKLEQLD